MTCEPLAHRPVVMLRTVVELRARWLAFATGLGLAACAATTARPVRVIDCTQGDYCGVLDERPAPAWSPRHEGLYQRGVRSILMAMACGRMPSRGQRLAYVAERDLSVSCAGSHVQIRRVKDREAGNRLLGAGRVDFVVEFDKAKASLVRGGIEVPLSASYYGRAGRAGADARLEGIDTYLVVETETTAEARLVARATL